jgi:SAM-dependent methyltransferase
MTGVSREQRLVFGEVAETYDRVRPSYPSRLVDDVVAFAPLGASDRVLEVGCGTGKATVQFAARGLQMLCLEPSAAMAAVAERNCERFPRVTVHVASFEDWPLATGAFRLLFSAQAWHWVSPDVRLPKARQALAPDGALAVFWNTVEWPDAEMRAEVDDLYQRLAPDLIAKRPGLPGTRSSRSLSVQELEDSVLFHSKTKREYRWGETYTTDHYLELLSTHSDHRMLSPDVLERLTDAMARLIEANGGNLRLHYVTRLLLARPANDLAEMGRR